jgi:hypothetical protein
MQAERGSRGITLLIFNVGARGGRVLSAAPNLLHTQEGSQVSIVQEAGWASGPVWMGVEKRKEEEEEPYR